MSDRKEALIVFHSDLDNTLIYSFRHEIGEEKVCVERYGGREASFMTKRSLFLLDGIRKKALFVPVTTRTEEQYGRIVFPAGTPDYALVCNGGVLLRAGGEVPEWYEDSRRRTKESYGELLRAERAMEQDTDRTMEVRNIRELFLFTKSGRPLRTAARLKEELDPGLVKVFTNGSKVYVLPEGLDKGTAVRRFRDYIKADRVLAAGDSEFDIPMLTAADLAYAPEDLTGKGSFGAHVRGITGADVFSDAFLQKVFAEI